MVLCLFGRSGCWLRPEETDAPGVGALLCDGVNDDIHGFHSDRYLGLSIFLKAIKATRAMWARKKISAVFAITYK